MQRIGAIYRRPVTRVTLWSGACVGVLAGLWLPRLWPDIWLWEGGWLLIMTLPAICLCFRYRCVLTCGVLLVAGGMVGLQRGTQWHHQLQQCRPLYGQKLSLTGYVAEDPSYDERHRLDFRVNGVSIYGQELPGEVRVWTQGAAGLQRGDRVEVSGVLREGFGNYQAAISFAQVRIVAKSAHPIEKLRRQFFVGVYNAVADPQASLGLGFLVGFKSQLPADLEEQLRMLALTHIVVASGYNLTVLVRLAKRMLLRVSKFQALMGSLALMSVMLMLTGLSPSMTRAGVVTFLSLATWYYGRTIHPILLLFLSAALTAWWNPLSTWSDLGWWLSFLAFTGVLVVGPLLTRRLYGERSPPALVQVAIETVAAQVMVEPLIMLLFGEFSVLGLLANMLVVSFVPLAMLATFVAGLGGMWLPALAGWLALPAELILGYIIEVVRLLARVPWASKELPISVAGLVVLYVSLALAVGIAMRRTNFRFREVPNVID